MKVYRIINKAARDVFVFYFYIMKKGGRDAGAYIIIYIFMLYPELKSSKRAWRITLQL